MYYNTPCSLNGKFIIRCTMASMGLKNTFGPCSSYRHLAASEHLPRLTLLGTTVRGLALGLPRRGMHEDDRVSLIEVVLDCTKQWFHDALKEARAGDTAVQVLVGLMCVASARTPTRLSKNCMVLIVTPKWSATWKLLLAELAWLS